MTETKSAAPAPAAAGSAAPAASGGGPAGAAVGGAGAAGAAEGPSFVQRASLRLLNIMLARLVKRGTLFLVDAEGRAHRHGDGGDPRAEVRLHDPTLYAKLFWNPELVAGEAYMDGTLTYGPEGPDGSIRDLLRVFHVNAQNLRAAPLRRFLGETVKKARRLQQHNPVAIARENVAHHYDLSNEFYAMFLDADMNYSCAYYTDEAMSLEDAQRAKQRHIAAKLRLEPGMRVVDIGCGWGGMALYLAENFDVEVVGLNLSSEQRDLALQRARDKGLADKVDVRLADYRQVTETFDRVVSVGMFEHVGAPYYRAFFDKLYDLLADDGLALLHAIGRKGPPTTTGPWIRKYIFPGGYSPALSETFAAIERAGLWSTDVEILRMHYAHTLNAWLERFNDRRGDVAALFDERFCRMWEFYLSTAEFAFRHGGHMVFQIQLAKAVDAVPITRDYMMRAEADIEAAAAPRRDGVHAA